MFNNYIFDFDGVIINSHQIQRKAFIESFQQIHGDGTPPIEAFFKHSGRSLTDILNALHLSLNMIPIYQKISRENIMLIDLYKEVCIFIKELKSLGCNVSLCTGKDRTRTIEILQYFDIEDLFDLVICSDDTNNPKPHPESMFKINARLNASPSNTLMVGDSVNDILFAKNAGVKSLAVTWGEGKKSDLLAVAPDIIIDDFDQLYSLLKKNSQRK